MVEFSFFSRQNVVYLLGSTFSSHKIVEMFVYQFYLNSRYLTCCSSPAGWFVWKGLKIPATFAYLDWTLPSLSDTIRRYKQVIGHVIELSTGEQQALRNGQEKIRWTMLSWDGPLEK